MDVFKTAADDDSMEGVRMKAATVVDRGALCQQRVASCFSLPGARRLVDRATSEKSQRCLLHVLPLLSLMSTLVEKQHLWGKPLARGSVTENHGRASRLSDLRDGRQAEAPSDANHCDEEGARRESSGAATVLACAGFFLL